jgi:hypothetical protein
MSSAAFVQATDFWDCAIAGQVVVDTIGRRERKLRALGSSVPKRSALGAMNRLRV